MMNRSDGLMSPDKFRNARSEARSKAYARFECEHENTHLCRNQVKGGSWQLFEQCENCGERVGNAMSQVGVDLSTVPYFDESIATEYRKRRESELASIDKRFDDQAWFLAYSEYLKTPQWRDIRARVLKRANNLCEGCRAAPATQAHHLTYEHVGREFLFELVALCDACHERIHAEEGDRA